jgi:colicin import membrane protein
MFDMAVKEAKKVPARPKRGKAETQQAFADIMEEVDEAPAVDAKTAAAAQLRDSNIRHSVEGVTVEAVVQKISGLGLEVSRSLAAVSEKLSLEVELLASVREAVALEQQELERLHKIDIAATSLDQLVQDYGQEKQKLEAGIAGQREAWEDEAEATVRERKEQDEALKKQRQREIEEYEYKKALERKKAQDKYDEDIRVRDKKNPEKQETLDADWAKRDAALKEREAEVARLLKDAETFPARLLAETEAAAGRGRKEAESRLEQQILVLKKDAETERRLAELQVKTLEDAIARNATQIAALEKQLADAKQQVQDIAVKAIEGASGARALSHINQIAMEQAKNRPQG